MEVVARYSAADCAYLKKRELDLLRAQTMEPPTPVYEPSQAPISVYMEKLLLVATEHCSKTPPRWDDANLDADYVEMRLRIVHRLQTTTLDSLENTSPAECEKKLAILDEFLEKVKR